MASADHDPLDPSDEALLREAAKAPFRDPSALALTGTTVGKYEVGEVLGRGAMGVVYAARDPSLDRRVALKVMAAETIGSAERRARFLREARTAAATSGPNIASVFEIGQHEDTVYFAMELVDGPTLRAHAARGLAISEVIRIARGIARGLSRAHAAGVIHRDLKPDNVMIDPAGEPKVLDFGLAKRVEIARDGAHDGSTELQTAEGRLLGTPAYMSPEQAKGHELDGKSDVFSFGVIVYELLAGKRPFAGATTIELLIAIDRDEPAPLPVAVPPALAALVRDCLAKSAIDRPTSAELETRLATMPSLSRRRIPRWLVPGALALGVAGAAYALWPRHDARYVEPTAVTSVPAALAAYEEGVTGDDSSASYERALALDPDFTAAHVRLAAWALGGQTGDPVGRDHLRKALAHEERLSPKLRGIAHALEPIAFVSPPDFHATAARFSELALRYPDDWFVAFNAANFHVLGGDDGVSGDAFLRLAERFPDVSKLQSSLGLGQLYAGHIDDARATLDRCIQRWPGATSCLSNRARLAEQAGECELLESLGRRIMLNAPTSDHGYRYLAYGLAGRVPSSSVRSALVGYEQHVPDGARAAAIAGNDSDAAAIDGDLPTAIARARAAVDAAGASTFRVAHAKPVRRLALLLFETGRAREAGDVIAAYLDGAATWQGPFFYELDLTGQLWALAVRTGARSRADARAATERWIASYNADSGKNYPPPANRWLHQHAFPAYLEDSADAATAALAALGNASPPAYEEDQFTQLAVGAVYLRAGRARDALPWLEQATHACQAVQFPVDTIWAWDLLGEAREAAGDSHGACAAYQGVISRWAKATESLTLAHARTRLGVLACAP